MSEGTESYDVGRGSPASGELTRVIDEAVDALALPVLGGSSGVDGHGAFLAAFASYREAVGERAAEQQRVGGLVAAMMDGVHRRLDRPAPPVLTGLIR